MSLQAGESISARRVDEADQMVEDGAGLWVFDTPVPGAEEHSGVEKYEQAEGEHSQPIQVKASLCHCAPRETLSFSLMAGLGRPMRVESQPPTIKLLIVGWLIQVI